MSHSNGASRDALRLSSVLAPHNAWLALDFVLAAVALCFLLLWTLVDVGTAMTADFALFVVLIHIDIANHRAVWMVRRRIDDGFRRRSASSRS